MAYFEDLGTTTQISDGPFLRAVGWLSKDHSFPTGKSPELFVARLRSVCEQSGKSIETLGWPNAGGTHVCEFCREFRSAGNIGVPAGPILFVAPEMVVHYVERHKYLPPAEFIEAASATPLPGTAGYVEAIAPFVVSPI
jgi:hypothetical protein